MSVSVLPGDDWASLKNIAVRYALCISYSFNEIYWG